MGMYIPYFFPVSFYKYVFSCFQLEIHEKLRPLCFLVNIEWFWDKYENSPYFIFFLQGKGASRKLAGDKRFFDVNITACKNDILT